MVKALQNQGQAVASAVGEAVKRCAIYIRVSTAMQRMEGWSLDAQRSALMAYAKSKGWKVVGVYADEGKTARKRLKERKEIFRLLEDVKAGKVDVILFKELDRWFRSVSDFYKVQDVLDEYGVTWVSAQQPNLGMTTKEDRLQTNLLLSVGQNETDSTSDRIKYTNKFMREQKRWTSGKGNLPRGYTLDDDQHVIIDTEQEPFVRDLIAAVMRIGTVRGALVETCEKHQTKMQYNNAMTLLKNTMLCGEYKEVLDFVERPYLTRAEFDLLQSRFKSNARKTEKHFYIFSAMIRCSVCGGSMTGSTTHKRGKDYRYYKCGRSYIMPDCPGVLSANEERVEKELLVYVQKAVEDRIVQVRQVIREQKARKPKKGNREQIERKLKRLKRLYVDDDMSWEEYQAQKEKILSQLIEEAPEEEVPDLMTLERIQALFDGGVLELYESFTREERRTFWRGILRTVYIKDGHVLDVDFIE